jgi:hypothetical protein
VGIDPTGGTSPDGPNVVWSAPGAPASFAPFSVSTPAAGETATLFLHATLNTTDTPATVVWDGAHVQGASLSNGGFEGPFVSQSTLTVPESWTAYYRDSGNDPISGRDIYTVYATWSSDGGSSWSDAMPVVANRESSGATTGAFGSDIYPIITTATDPPSVTFFFVYEAGDPPPGTSFLRFGRPVMVICTLGTPACSEPPGALLLPRNVVRPSQRLFVAADPFDPDRALLLWDALQMDYVHKDVYATYVTVR